jgi:monoamine oxidase
MSQRPDALILGGGLAGLIAARDLGEAGIAVTLLEGRDRLGGRTWTRPLAGTGIDAEFGASFFSRALQPTIAAEIVRYDVVVDPARRFSKAVWADRNGRREADGVLELFGPLYRPARPAVDRAIEAIRSALERGAPIPPGEDANAAEWIAALQVPDETRAALLSWMAAIGGGRPEDQSILVMTADLALSGLALEDSLEELGDTFSDGSRTLVDAIAADLAGPIHTEATVVSVRSGVDGVQVTTADGGRFEANACVVALPLNCLAAVEFDPPLPEPLRALAATGHPGRSTKVLAVAEGFGASTLGMAWERPLQAAVGIKECEPGTLLVGFDGVGRLASAHDGDAVEEALRVFEPVARVVACDSHDWIRDPFARGTWIATPPGWVEQGERLEQFDGRLAFAGSDLAVEGSGYMEGALASGRAAARKLIEGTSSATRPSTPPRAP